MTMKIILESDGAKQVEITLDPSKYNDKDWEKDKHGNRRKHYELKSCIAYEGWERLPQTQERYRLANKKVYCHGTSEMPFWDGAGLMLHRYWDLSYTDLIVLGGDLCSGYRFARRRCRLDK